MPPSSLLSVVSRFLYPKQAGKHSFPPANRLLMLLCSLQSPINCPALSNVGRCLNCRVRCMSCGALRKVLRCITPNRTNSAFSKLGIIWKTRFCSPQRRLVLKSYHVPKLTSFIFLPQLYDSVKSALQYDYLITLLA